MKQEFFSIQKIVIECEVAITPEQVKTLLLRNTPHLDVHDTVPSLGQVIMRTGEVVDALPAE